MMSNVASLLLLVITCQCLTGHAYEVVVEPQKVREGATGNFTVTCRKGGLPPTSFELISYIAITFNGDNQFVAFMRSLRGRANSDVKAIKKKCTAEGLIDNVDNTYLKVTCPIAKAQVTGTYTCHVSTEKSWGTITQTTDPVAVVSA